MESTGTIAGRRLASPVQPGWLDATNPHPYRSTEAALLLLYEEAELSTAIWAGSLEHGTTVFGNLLHWVDHFLFLLALNAIRLCQLEHLHHTVFDKHRLGMCLFDKRLLKHTLTKHLCNTFAVICVPK